MATVNKYTAWYRGIISRALSEDRIAGDVYYEKHHIVPKSLGGSNRKENLVLLTAREHFLCHWLLTKMYEGEARRKMLYALKRCSTISCDRKIISGWQYEVARKAQSDARRGTKHSEEHKKKISDAIRGKKYGPIPEERRMKIVEAAKRRVPRIQSEETKQRISLARKAYWDGVRAAKEAA